MLQFNRTSDNLIVAGNGPSLKNIDLNSMPKEYDVFRCNQFYCEDKYYLGKNIKLVMFNPMVIYSQLKTLNTLISKQEYHVEYV
ncbi:alpha-2,3-sialyltransferase, partial [Campylobacter sp. 2018MI27]